MRLVEMGAMPRRLSLVVALAAAFAVAVPASAQLPAEPSDPPAEPPTAKPAQIWINVASGRRDRGTRWVLTGDKLLVKGHMRPFVEGQKVQIELGRDNKVIERRTRKVMEDKGDKGTFQIRLDIRESDVHSVIVRHEATVEQEEAKSNRERFRSLPPRVSGEESTRLLQISLQKMKYISPLSGELDDPTRRAVLAWRKVNGWARTGSPTPGMFQKVFNMEGRYRPRYGDPSKHVEGDIGRQVIVLIEHGKPQQIYTMSSGKSSTPTVRGSFDFYRAEPGSNNVGMYYSWYFHGGYAVHGYPSVPATYPASHGCLRVPMDDAYRIYQWIDYGDRIYTFD